MKIILSEKSGMSLTTFILINVVTILFASTNLLGAIFEKNISLSVFSILLLMTSMILVIDRLTKLRMQQMIEALKEQEQEQSA